ncbi:MAG: hypothetical protein IPG89_10770 [Bacteroidetes bacterium]|nr:hypothetical protein [Bacteroidota bacterium]
MKRIIVTLEKGFPDKIDAIDISNIPLNLRELSPLLSKWAISDDFERNEKIKRSSKTSLKKLVDSVSPKINEITNYLDGFKNEPLSHEATLFQSLAELIMEISIRLESK